MRRMKKRVPRRSILIGGFLALLLVAASIVGFVQGTQNNVQAAAETLNQPYVRVVGTGTVTAVPDEAVVTVGVQTRAATAEQAVKDNGPKMQSVMAALKKQGIADADMQTQGFHVQEEYDDSREGQAKPRGYVVTHQLKVTVQQVDRVGAVLDAAVKAGANQVHGVMFRLSKEKELQVAQQALQAAFKQAGAKARTLAEQAGGQLGRVLAVDEQMGQPPVIVQDASLRMAEHAVSDATPAVSVGQMEYEVQVSVTYQLR